MWKRRKIRKSIFIFVLTLAAAKSNFDGSHSQHYAKSHGQSNAFSNSSSSNSDFDSQISNSFSRSSPSTSTSTSTSTLPSEKLSNAASLVEVYEHEFYDLERKAWVGGSNPSVTHRWTSSPTNLDANTKVLPPPPQLMPPKGYDFTSEWKIDVTGSTSIRDELGWEYFIDNHDHVQSGSGSVANGRRRRRWLRGVAFNTYVEEGEEEKGSADKRVGNTTKAMSMQQSSESTITDKSKHPISEKKKLKRNRFRKKIFKELGDSYNFKGYGVSLNKSMLNRQTCGIILRLPLTSHFDFFEMRPWLPLLTSSCSFHYPLMRGTLSINASLPVALFKYIVLTLWDQTKFAFTLIWYLIAKTIVIDILGILILSNIAKILGFGTKNLGQHEKIRYDARGEPIESKNVITSLKIFQDYPKAPLKRDIQYSTRISERLGVSLSWHFTDENGPNIRWTWFHSYLPTIEHIGDVSQNMIYPFVKNKKKQHPPLDASKVKEWLRQKIGSFGLTWGGFAPERPFYFCSTTLSLSGFYYGGQSLKKLYTAPQRLFSSADSPITKQKTSSPSRMTSKVDRNKREKHFQEIIQDSDDLECEIIDVKVSAS